MLARISADLGQQVFNGGGYAVRRSDAARSVDFASSNKIGDLAFPGIGYV